MKDQYAVYLCKEPKWQTMLRKAQAKHYSYHLTLAAQLMDDIRAHAKPILIDGPITLKCDGYNVMMEVNKKPA